MSFGVILAALTKSIIYGLSVVATGDLTRDVHVLDVLALRYLITIFAMFLMKKTRILPITVGVRDFYDRKRSRPRARTLLLAGLLEPVLYMFLETLGISLTTSVTAGVIYALLPIFCCICEGVVLGEKTGIAEKMFLLVGLIGVVYISVKTDVSDGQNSLVGIFCLLASMFCTALFSSVSRKMSRDFSPLDRCYVMCMLGAVAFNGASLVRHLALGTLGQYFAPLCSLQNLLPFLYLGVVCSVVAVSLENYTYSNAQISSLAAFGGVSTLVTVMAGVLLFDEKLYMYHYIGFFLIFLRIAGVTVIQRRKQLVS